MALRIALLLTLWFSGPIWAQDPSVAQTMSDLAAEMSRMDRIAVSLGDATVVDRLSSDFSSFLGSDAEAVVGGLRVGTPFTLARITAQGEPGSAPVRTTVIDPAVGKMGFGNVFISLALAKQQLSQLGITQPTPEQLQIALTGGAMTAGSGANFVTTNVQGILAMRSREMGWGQIAQKLGVKLGPVLSDLKRTNHGLVTGAVSPSRSGMANPGDQPAGGSQAGIATEAGSSPGSPNGLTTDRGQGHAAPALVPSQPGQSKGHSK